MVMFCLLKRYLLSRNAIWQVFLIKLPERKGPRHTHPWPELQSRVKVLRRSA